MTRIKLDVQITGTRDGEEWPRPGYVIDLPEAEAQDLIAAGAAHEPADDEPDAPRKAKPYESVGIANRSFPDEHGRTGPVIEESQLAPRDAAVARAAKAQFEGDDGEKDYPKAGTEGSKILDLPQSPNPDAPAETTAKSQRGNTRK